MPDLNLIEWIFFISVILLATSILINRFLFRHHESLARKIRGGQIIVTVISLSIHGWLCLGMGNTVVFILLSFAVSALFEFIGVKTGWLFGQYTYTKKSGPGLAGLPISIPLMWCIVMYLGFWQAIMMISGMVISTIQSYGLLFIITPLLITFLDLVVDPIAVDEGLWIWKKNGKYVGIPLTNFLSWFLTGLVILVLSFFLIKTPDFRRESLTWMCVSAAFGFCFLSGVSTRVCFERKLKIPGRVGLILTGICLVMDLYVVLFKL